MNNQAIQSIKTNETFVDNPTPVQTHYIIIKPADSVAEFISNWRSDFTERMRNQANSKKRNWTYSDAVGCTSFINSSADKLMIRYVAYIGSNPLLENDYYRYVDSYSQGRKLDEYYFKHDLSKLKEYYKKVDKAKERDEPYNAFSVSHWREYVLYMMLKLEGLYSTEYDDMFRISITDDREYNPITQMASEMRPYLPFKIKEYDISQANPTFLLMELGIPYFDVYERMGNDRAKAKSEFNALINFHKDVKGITIESTRDKLKPVFKERTNEVMTQERFDNKGQMHRDLTKHEREYIGEFAKANKLSNYVRLHDGVVVSANVKCEVLEFDSVVFKEKEITKPEVINIVRNWYEYNGEDYETSPSQYKNWFVQEGFMRISEKERDELTIIKNKNKILIPYNHTTDINALLANHINEFDVSSLENQIASDTRAIQDGFKLMEAVPYKLHKDTKDEVFIPFKNGVVKITADEVGMVSYDDDSIGLFAEHETQTRDFEFKPEYADRTYFKDFLVNGVIGRNIQDNPELNNDENNKLYAFMTMIGYLVSNYKDPANVFAIILSDEGANDEHRRGRRGKSLILEAIKSIRVFNEKKGETFDPNYTHVYADLKKSQNVYLIDDLKASFNYSSLYSVITGGITAERKGKEAETIPFDTSPKFLMSTNWAVRHDKKADSTNARFKEYQFTDFWNIDNKPNEYFKESFFTGWDGKQWNDFYCFIAVCVQSYLKNGLKTIKYDKEKDNFSAYFSNDVTLDEFERVFNTMNLAAGFSASEFLMTHQQNALFKYNPMFHIRNVKSHLLAYAEYKGIDLYCDRQRKWKSREAETEFKEKTDKTPF